MRLAIAVVLLTLCGIAIAECGTELSSESIPQIVARKALRGDFRPLQDWQQRGYECLAVHGAKEASVWITHYTPKEGFKRGAGVRWGQGCSERVGAAIMIDRRWFNGLPPGKRNRHGLDLSRMVWTGDYILLDIPADPKHGLAGGYELRQILDTGAMSNLSFARRKHANIWVDRWTDNERLRNVSWVRTIYVANGS